MGVDCPILAMFKGNRSDETYMQLRGATFMMGAKCNCGAKISSEKEIKPVCDTKDALCNHILFPTFSLLKLEGSSYENNNYPRHYAFLVDVCQIPMHEGLPMGAIGFTTANEKTFVDLRQFFSTKNDVICEFSPSNLKVGYTIAVLYARRSEKCVIVRNPEHCFIFKAPLEDVKEEGRKLLNDGDLASRNEELMCFGCEAKVLNIKKCSGCKLAKYCSQECQLKEWNLRHKKLCSQNEIILRLACLPRQQDKLYDFTFSLDETCSLPSYVFNPDFLQPTIDKAYNWEMKPREKAKRDDKCGLCGKNNQQAYISNGKGLTKTDCCSNWICDDTHMYKLGSYLTNSCYRSHGKYTICGTHHDANHPGNWKTCKKCVKAQKKVTYDDHATNKFNFDPLKNVEKEEIWCRNCGFVSFELKDFAGSTPCCALDDNYFCKKPACARKGGFYVSENATFMHSTNNPLAAENEQRMISIARTAIRSSLNLPAQSSSVEDLSEEAEKMLRRTRYSPALRCLSLAIDKIILENPINKMNLREKEQLVRLYIKRAQCYMQMADKLKKLRYANLCSDDCDFIINEENLDKSLILIQLSDLHKRSREFIQRHMESDKKQRENRRQRHGQTRNSQRRSQRNNNQSRQSNRDPSERKEYAETTEEESGPILTSTSSSLLESKIAINGLSEDDHCPICYMQWCNLNDPTIVVILPCNHAACASCLFRYNQACLSVPDDENEKPKFSCVLCRKVLSISTMQEVALDVVRKNLIPSFIEFANQLPFTQEEFENLVSSLLLEKFEFEISLVENALFNMMGLIDRNEKLDYEKKQEYYELARAPVLKLQEEYSNLRQEILLINDTESSEWKNKKKRLQELNKLLNEARKNAANDIFERMNSGGNMGALIEEEDGQIQGLVHVDLHGLHVKEAKERVNEYVLPILPALKKVILITGYGLHNQDGNSVLKENMKKYFVELKIKCEDVTKNRGALCIYA